MGVVKAESVVPPLPAEYQRVKYIAVDDDSCYVNTGITVTIGYIIWVDAQFRHFVNGTGILGFLTSVSSSTYKTWNISWYQSNTGAIAGDVFTAKYNSRRTAIECDTTVRHLFTLDSKNNLFIIDDKQASLDFSGYVPTSTLKLGKVPTASSSPKPIIWLAGYKKPDDTEHFIVPCYRKQDDVNGVFCTETQAFHEFTGATSRGANI